MPRADAQESQREPAPNLFLCPAQPPGHCTVPAALPRRASSIWDPSLERGTGMCPLPRAEPYPWAVLPLPSCGLETSSQAPHQMVGDQELCHVFATLCTICLLSLAELKSPLRRSHHVLRNNEHCATPSSKVQSMGVESLSDLCGSESPISKLPDK